MSEVWAEYANTSCSLPCNFTRGGSNLWQCERSWRVYSGSNMYVKARAGKLNTNFGPLNKRVKSQGDDCLTA